MVRKMSEMPNPVRQLVVAATENAKAAWGEDDVCAQDVVYACEESDGRWAVSDNYERFFSTIYTYDPASDEWTTRVMYGDCEEKPYPFEKVLADASVLFTG